MRATSTSSSRTPATRRPAATRCFSGALLDALSSEGIAPKAKNAERVYEIGPEAVSRSVSLRLSRLPVEATSLAQAVAVLGDDVRLTDAATLAGIDPELAAHTATTLARNGLLRVERHLAFVHPVVRASVYAELNGAERERKHAAAAALLAEANAPTEQIAAHLLLTRPGSVELGISTLRHAADRALAKGDPDAAASYLRRAAEEPLEDPERADLLYRLGLAERLVDSPLAARHLREAHALTTDTIGRARIALDLGRTLLYSLQVDEAVQVLEAAITSVGETDLDLCRRLEAGLLTVTLIFPPLYPLARKQIERVQKLPLGDDLGSRQLLGLVAFNAARTLGDRTTCVEYAERAVAGGALFSQDNAAFAFSTVTLTVADSWESARGIFDDAFADARIRGSISAFAVASIFRGYLHVFTGDLTEAEADLQNAVDASRQHGLASGMPYALAFLADAQMQRGRPRGGDRDACAGRRAARARARARLRLRRPRPAALPPGPLPRRARRVREGTAGLRGGRGDEPRGRRVALAVGARAPPARRDRGGEAARGGRGRARSPLGCAARAGQVTSGRRDDRRRGERARAAGRVGRPAARLGGDPRACAGSPRARLGAQARKPPHRRARVPEAGPRARPPRRVERRSRARAQDELMATGARPRRVALSGLDALTPSERRVAGMAAKELTNRDIAQALFVTPKTVEVHLSSVYRKLGIASRAQLADALGSSRRQARSALG